MIIAVIGKEKSGKSSLAEAIALDVASGKKKVYLATMQIIDDASKDRVKRHRRMREGKGFITVEQLYDIGNCLDFMNDLEDTTVLLECVSNLVGNEMYRQDREFSSDEVLAQYIIGEIVDLSGKVSNLICVCNEFSEDENIYDEATNRFIGINNYVNQLLRKEVDIIHEVG